MRILALFDDGASCVRKALRRTDDVLSVGIENKNGVYQLDLSQIENVKVIERLHKENPFDLIFACPPCESWSFATGSRGGNAFRWKHNLAPKTFHEFIQNTYYSVAILDKDRDDITQIYERYFRRAVNGTLTAMFVFEVIKRLNIPFVIENPKTSMIWRFFEGMGLQFVKNIAVQSAYCEARSLKPTCFASNKVIPLIDKGSAKIKFQDIKGARGDGGVRANIPEKLIRDIVENFREKEIKNAS